MKNRNFQIKSKQEFLIEDFLSNNLFECYSVKLREGAQQTTNTEEKNFISSFSSVHFGVKGQSAFGFRVSYIQEQGIYQLSVPPMATSSDWAGALMFMKLLVNLTKGEIYADDNEKVSVENITASFYISYILEDLQVLSSLLKSTSDVIKFLGVRRPIYFNQSFLSMILMVEDNEILENYDKRILLTQNVQAYFSEQKIYKLEVGDKSSFLGVAYLNMDTPTVLPFKPTLTQEEQKYYKEDEISEWRLFIMNSEDKKKAEVEYESFLSNLPTGKLYMLDAVYALIPPFSISDLG
ncbi:DUF4299 family protein [Streptococcus oricebi]|uniref:DUF4299 family protein n=1 Tax=Streptococcus oricebi TaxID=1547447 RepID=A0ABS5B752_9STRE|nr:DUF4299 family protein [Streptococcus oricebi]MBP2623839.1 hypothetical protein [Streptococcus oricebi]